MTSEENEAIENLYNIEPFIVRRFDRLLLFHLVTCYNENIKLNEIGLRALGWLIFRYRKQLPYLWQKHINNPYCSPAINKELMQSNIKYNEVDHLKY